MGDWSLRCDVSPISARKSVARMSSLPTIDLSPPAVVLYMRAGCHLCDEAKQQLSELRRHVAFTLRAVDIDQDPELRQRYNDEIPVIFIDGRKAFSTASTPANFSGACACRDE